MGKITILKKETNDENINSALFLKYIIAHGFDPNNYHMILELLQSANGSMSQFLKPFNQYLLSKQVDYDDLDKIGINGACGYLRDDDIFIPKTIGNDNRFLFASGKRLYTRHNDGAPTIDDFDVIIANGISPFVDIKNAANFDIDKYLGFCMDDTDENLAISLRRYQYLANFMNRETSDEYVYEHDRISSRGKQLCLIRKK